MLHSITDNALDKITLIRLAIQLLLAYFMEQHRWSYPFFRQYRVHKCIVWYNIENNGFLYTVCYRQIGKNPISVLVKRKCYHNVYRYKETHHLQTKRLMISSVILPITISISKHMLI